MREVLFRPRSNRETWIEQFAFVDCESDEGIRLTYADGTPRFAISAQLRPELEGYHPFYGGGPFYDRPLPAPVTAYGGPLATLDNGGVNIIDAGVIEVRFALYGVRPGRWSFSLLLDDGYDRIEPWRGFLSVLPW